MCCGPHDLHALTCNRREHIKPGVRGTVSYITESEFMSRASHALVVYMQEMMTLLHCGEARADYKVGADCRAKSRLHLLD